MSDLTNIHERLAAIEATQSHQGRTLESIDGKLDKFGERITNVEISAAKYGSVAGGVMSVAVALITSKFKGV